jgi:hypothetical protein
MKTNAFCRIQEMTLETGEKVNFSRTEELTFTKDTVFLISCNKRKRKARFYTVTLHM